MSQKKAAIVTIGNFDATGRPAGWEFDRNVRLNEADDGSWTIGGYTKDELQAIMDKHVAESGEEVKEEKVVEQKPAPTVFQFRATIVGVKAIKPSKMEVHKELKLLSSDVDELAQIDKLLESGVEVFIVKRGAAMTADEFFEEMRHKYDADEAAATDEEEAAAEEPEQKEGELDLSGDGEGDPEKPEEAATGETEPPAEPPAEEPAAKEPVVIPPCDKCGADLAENPDDTAQLICTNATCAEVYANPNADEVEFD